MSNDRAGNGKDNDKDRAVAKTAGFVVFSGIAMSILKALNPLNKPNLQCTHNNTNNGDQTEPVGGDSTQTDHKHQSFSLQEPTIKKPITSVEQNVPGSSQRKVEIVKGGANLPSPLAVVTTGFSPTSDVGTTVTTTNLPKSASPTVYSTPRASASRYDDCPPSKILNTVIDLSSRSSEYFTFKAKPRTLNPLIWSRSMALSSNFSSSHNSQLTTLSS
ncbi:hypothetical protein RHGRI_017519 [Rhododendron griersonianum]|uniref:Uncharacterized protein n=1 Tax=Rhododendron griersonianum TaxID=479676 RepID=A0AAV6JY19_9ERIC|nr:hypothetical protein RHGRI_017519 [Rhododendron griersonianum]